MTRQTQRPVRTADTGPGYRDDYLEDHPAYGLIGASRVSSTGTPLFGSDFLHQNFMTIRIRRATLRRGLSRDYVSGAGHPEIIEVALSEAQWATFLSTPNMGDGVPCTIQWLQDEGMVPGIEPDNDRREQFNAEIDERLQNAIKMIDDLAAAISSSTKLGVKERDALAGKARHARMELNSNLAFVAQSFDEHAEKTIEKAKIEFEAYMNNAVHRAGLQALGGVAPISLPAGEDPA